MVAENGANGGRHLGGQHVRTFGGGLHPNVMQPPCVAVDSAASPGYCMGGDTKTGIGMVASSVDVAGAAYFA